MSKSSAEPRHIALFGATGTIGSNALSLVRAFPELFTISTLTAHRDVDTLITLAREFHPKRVVIADETLKSRLRDALPAAIAVTAGNAALIEAAKAPCDMFISAIVGFAALAPTMAAIEAGHRVALANKECLVAAGVQLMHAASQHQTLLLPVDSEHNGLFQCWHAVQDNRVDKVTLTASGGPFRSLPKAALEKVTVAQAVAHPNWTMGAKISVDSATLMNKGLELIEARYLFDLQSEQLDVLVHPQSIMHCMIRFADGSHIAQLALPDMRTPLAHAMHYPQRLDAGLPTLDLATIGTLEFEQPDMVRFPCLKLAQEAMIAGQAAEIRLNAANEIAVEAFLSGTLRFTQIPEIIDKMLQMSYSLHITTLDDVIESDHITREQTRTVIDACRETR